MRSSETTGAHPSSACVGALALLLFSPAVATAGPIADNPYAPPIPSDPTRFETCVGGSPSGPAPAVRVRLIEGTLSLGASAAVLTGTVALGPTTCVEGRPIDAGPTPFQVTRARILLSTQTGGAVGSLGEPRDRVWASLEGRGTIEASGVRIEDARIEATREDGGVIRVARGRVRIDGCDRVPADGSRLDGRAVAIAAALRCGERRFVQGTVRVTEGAVAGTLEVEPASAETPATLDARAVVHDGMNEIQRCYERAARRAGFGAVEHLVVDISVSARGQVRSVGVSEASSRPLAECVESTVRGWTFGRTPDGFAISVPIALRPRD